MNRFTSRILQVAVSARSMLATDLREALQSRQFLLYYQPQIDINGKLSGAEALVWWQHPGRGQVPPNDFIPRAEETGLILPLGQWVLEAACKQLARWATHFGGCQVCWKPLRKEIAMLLACRHSVERPHSLRATMLEGGLMQFRLAADGVLLLHLAFILFVLFGGALAARWRRMPWLHLPAALWGFGVELTGRTCPLTYLENDLRQRAGQSGYTDSFVEHYLLDVIYPTGLTHELQLALAATVVVVNLVIYGWLALRRSAQKKLG